MSIEPYVELWEDWGVEMRKTSNKKNFQSLKEIKSWLGNCKRCRLCETRNQIVFGEGSSRAKVFFVGEGPGADEDAQGLPFIGRAGQLLTKIIDSMGLTRESVYIANVVKCRPPKNRVPEEDEIKSCSVFLKAQIELVKPDFIVALGLTATRFLLDSSTQLSEVRGQFQNLAWNPQIQVLPTYHPAYLLRNPSAKKIVWDDMKKLIKKL